MSDVKFTKYTKFDEECKQDILSFINGVKIWCYTDDDGYGYYATDTEISDQYVNIYAILKNVWPNWATHVVWYNK